MHNLNILHREGRKAHNLELLHPILGVNARRPLKEGRGNLVMCFVKGTQGVWVYESLGTVEEEGLSFVFGVILVVVRLFLCLGVAQGMLGKPQHWTDELFQPLKGGYVCM